MCGRWQRSGREAEGARFDPQVGHNSKSVIRLLPRGTHTPTGTDMPAWFFFWFLPFFAAKRSKEQREKQEKRAMRHPNVEPMCLPMMSLPCVDPCGDKYTRRTTRRVRPMCSRDAHVGFTTCTSRVSDHVEPVCMPFRVHKACFPGGIHALCIPVWHPCSCPAHMGCVRSDSTPTHTHTHTHVHKTQLCVRY